MRVFRPFRFMSKIEIEAAALDIWLKMEQELGKMSLPVDASTIAEFLDLDLVWDDITDDDQGAIAARILPLEKLIEINDNIPELRGGFGESTIAHEIGHWILHIDTQKVASFLRLQEKGVEIQLEPFLCRRNDANLASIEWQAQYFAGCLLMPQHLLAELKQGKDLTKWRHLYQLAGELGVTISNLTVRLQDLGWIFLEPDTGKITTAKKFFDALV